MDYRIEVYDMWGRRSAVFEEVPLLEATRNGPDGADEIRGLLPAEIVSLGPGYRIRVLVDGRLFCEAPVQWTAPQWGDTRKLILDRYVPFHEIVEFGARGTLRAGNTIVRRAFQNREIGALARDIINSAPGPLHYYVDHLAYPEGAMREYGKFVARRRSGDLLEIGGISTGSWVGGARIDASAAWAKDGDTLAGVRVDGEVWPDIRLMVIDAEETTRNAHAIKRHPEVAFWSDARYDASDYARRAQAAKQFLQHLLDTKGIDFIELNPHRNTAGEYDDRVDAYGRHLGLVFGGGECFNAAIVEQGLAEVYLHNEGRYLVPDLALKEFYSYAGSFRDSIVNTGVSIEDLDIECGALEIVAALAYYAGGYVFAVDPALGVSFRTAAQADRTISFDPLRMNVQLGADAARLCNILYLSGNPLPGGASLRCTRGESIGEYGPKARRLESFSMSAGADLEKLGEGLLADLAYPAPSGWVTLFGGDARVKVGDLIKVRDGPLRRLGRALPGEWAGRFEGRMAGRVCRVRHRFCGKETRTMIFLTSPLRSVEDPLAFLVRGQGSASSLFEFRLDDAAVGLDMGFHLD